MVLSDTSVTRGQCWGESKQQKREVMLKGLWQGPSDQRGCQMFFPLLLSQLCFLRRAPAEWNCPQQEEKWSLPGFRLLPWGWGWRMWENIHYLPVLAFLLEGLICFFVPLKQHFPNTYVGCTQALYSRLHFPLSHPGYLSLLFLRLFGYELALPTCRTTVTKAMEGTDQWDTWLAAARFLLSEHYLSLMSWNSQV